MATVGCPFTRLDWSCSLCVIANVLAAIRNSTLLHQAVEVLPHRAEGLPHLLQHRGHEHSLPRTGRRSQAVKPLSFRQWPLVAQAPARANTYLLLLGEPREKLVVVVSRRSVTGITLQPFPEHGIERRLLFPGARPGFFDQVGVGAQRDIFYSPHDFSVHEARVHLTPPEISSSPARTLRADRDAPSGWRCRLSPRD